MPDSATDHSMGKYRLSKATADDLMGIALFGDEHFGIGQSNRFRDQLKQRFSVLAEQPLLYPPVDHIRSPLCLGGALVS